MPKRGPIPLEAHAMVEPIIGLLFILAPFIFSFDDSSAKTLSIVIGVVILLSGMSTRWRLSLVKLIPLRVHFMTDVLIGIVCIVAPFVLGFSDETEALVFFLVLGVGELGAAFMTAWEPGDYKAGAKPRPSRSEPLSGA
jgi:uncharacterized membrane protein HdeD (DUF308 family)